MQEWKKFLLVKIKVKFLRPGVVLTADINFRLAGGMLSRGGADTYQNRLEGKPHWLGIVLLINKKSLVCSLDVLHQRQVQWDTTKQSLTLPLSHSLA